MQVRIAIHDFVGHPFQVQLSREMARRGHTVMHMHFPGFQTGKGRLTKDDSDPPTFSICPIRLDSEYPKYSYGRRLLADKRYVKQCSQELARFEPDVLLSGNASPAVQAGLQRYCGRRAVAFINWVQDCYGVAAERWLLKKFGFLGGWIGSYIRHVEEKTIRRSDHTVLIAEEFRAAFRESSLKKATVIENWAPLEELPLRSKANPWSRLHGIDQKKVYLYSGTIGLKHNPELLVRLALSLREDKEKDSVVVVISEGLGRTYLEERKRAHNLQHLIMLDFQPFDCLPDVVASGDVLIAMIEEDAGAFSVPSKVLTYLCASRPLLLSVPKDNLAARIVLREQAGAVVEPDDADGFVSNARTLMANPEASRRLGERGRQYATSAFDIKAIGDRFEEICLRASQVHRHNGLAPRTGEDAAAPS